MGELLHITSAKEVVSCMISCRLHILCKIQARWNYSHYPHPLYPIWKGIGNRVLPTSSSANFEIVRKYPKTKSSTTHVPPRHQSYSSLLSNWDFKNCFLDYPWSGGTETWEYMHTIEGLNRWLCQWTRYRPMSEKSWCAFRLNRGGSIEVNSVPWLGLSCWEVSRQQIDCLGPILLC